MENPDKADVSEVMTKVLKAWIEQDFTEVRHLLRSLSWTDRTTIAVWVGEFSDHVQEEITDLTCKDQ